MNMLGELSGSIDRDQLRFDRIKQILDHDEEEMKQEMLDKDDARFIQLHLEHK